MRAESQFPCRHASPARPRGAGSGAAHGCSAHAASLSRVGETRGRTGKMKTRALGVSIVLLIALVWPAAGRALDRAEALKLARECLATEDDEDRAEAAAK